jgi:alkylhydroperoxidase family enzyme
MQPDPLPLPLQSTPSVGRYHRRLGEAIARYSALLSSFMRPALVELCQLRITQIVRGSDAAPIDASEAQTAGISPAQLAELATWYTSDRFDATERACLQLAEYFCYSAQSVTDEIVAEVSANLSAEQVLALTNAIWVSDSSLRLSNYLESVGAREATA